MNDKLDTANGWFRKAENDYQTLCMLHEQGKALDVAAFHAQQAIEKLLKCLLILNDTPFPFTHDLEELRDLCRVHNPSIDSLPILWEEVSDFAVAARYDFEFFPPIKDIDSLIPQVEALRSFVSTVLSNQASTEQQ